MEERRCLVDLRGGSVDVLPVDLTSDLTGEDTDLRGTILLPCPIPGDTLPVGYKGVLLLAVTPPTDGLFDLLPGPED